MKIKNLQKHIKEMDKKYYKLNPHKIREIVIKYKEKEKFLTIFLKNWQDKKIIKFLEMEIKRYRFQEIEPCKNPVKLIIETY